MSGVAPSGDARAAAMVPAGGGWRFKVLIDGACPLCRREARVMERLDKGRGWLALEDISAGGFDPSVYGRTMEQVMGSIHGVTAEGRVVEGVEVFRRAYAAVGWGWVLGWTGWPVARPIVDAAYRVFARVRLKLPGRHGARCEDGTCKVV